MATPGQRVSRALCLALLPALARAQTVIIYSRVDTVQADPQTLMKSRNEPY